MAMPQSGRSVPELFTDLINQFTTLFRKEIQLARTEISEKIGEAISGLGIIIGGVVAAGIGYLLIRSGMNNLSPENLKPTKTVEQLQRDAVAAKEQVS
jgi:hypothetical protein